MKEIKLSKKGKHAGKYVALVDDEDYERVNQYNWNVSITNNTNYVQRASQRDPITKKQKTIHLHSFILGNKPGFIIDHKDRNGLNNQKYNLRFATYSENNKNSKSCGSSNYLGVCWYNARNKWIAHITINGKNKYLGVFKNEIDAAKVYDNAAKIHHKEFANLNFK